MTYTIRRPTTVGLLSRGRDYSVRDLGATFDGYTDLLKRELGVSLDGASPLTRWMQLHELSHVRHSLWSPKRVAERMARMGREVPSVDAILAAEDARINELMTRRVTDAHDGFRLTVPHETLRRDLEGYVACHASPEACADAIRPSVDPAHVAMVDGWMARLRTMPERELTVLRVTVPLALLIDSLREGTPLKGGKGGDDSESKRKSKSEPAADGSAKPAAESDEDEADKSDGGEESADAPPGDVDDEGDDPSEDTADAEAFGEPDGHMGRCAGPLPTPTSKGPMAPWVIPEVVEPTLTVPMRGGNFQVTTAETGTALRWAHLHRMSTDGVVFRRNRRRPGALQRGTVLIDVSSSMSFTDKSLQAIVEMLPYATVAVYSGDGGKRAYLVVVARNGKRVARVAGVPRGSGNTCDGPALLWLSRQAAPRLWICDGRVTGVSDYPADWHAEECAAMMQAAGVVQVCGGPEGTLRATRTLTQCAIYTPADILAAELEPLLKRVEQGRVEG